MIRKGKLRRSVSFQRSMTNRIKEVQQSCSQFWKFCGTPWTVSRHTGWEVLVGN